VEVEHGKIREKKSMKNKTVLFISLFSHRPSESKIITKLLKCYQRNDIKKLEATFESGRDIRR